MLKVRIFALVAIAVVVMVGSVSAQCVGPRCQIDQLIKNKVASAQAEGPSSQAAVRIHAGNGCGSGSVCGDGLILTNAHVVGTRVGRKVTVRPKATGRDIEGVVIMAAYSDRTLADWAIVKCDTGLEGITPVRLATDTPSGRHYTTGSPRCVWPLRSTAVVTADIADNSPLWRWRPNAIGGQSGSGVWAVGDDLCYGLLTWSWGGLGAGQQTAVIYKQARERSTDGPDRVTGLVELIEPAPFQQGEEVVVETGYFAQAGIRDFDIWGNQDQTQPPVEPVPQPNCGLSETEVRVIAAMRSADRKNYDTLVQIVIGIFSLSN